MALGDSAIGICNAALLALGEMPIASLTDNSRAALMCGARYDQVRRAVLRMQPWNCAITQATLAAAATAPAFQYDNAYAMPADCLRLWDCPDADDDMMDWQVQSGAPFGISGSAILTDYGPPLNILYVRDVQDATQFDALLTETIAAQLAVELALPLTQSAAKLQAAQAALSAKLDAARLVSSQENSPKEWDEDVLLRSRI